MNGALLRCALSRTSLCASLLGLLLLSACGPRSAKGPEQTPPGPLQPPGPAAPNAPPSAAPAPDGGVRPDGGGTATIPPAPSERVLVYDDGHAREVPLKDVPPGYTLIDLRDSWTPLIFATARDAKGEERPNRYRRIYIGLAGDRLDADGLPLAAGEKNYLELFGIPPALSVLRERFLSDEKRTCDSEVDFAKLAAVKSVRYVPESQRKAAQAKLARLRKVVEAQQKKRPPLKPGEAAPPPTPEEAELARSEAEQGILGDAEKRLRCEGIWPARGVRHTPGAFDDGFQEVLRHFQQKHMVYEPPYLRKDTMARLAQRPLDNDLDSLRRVLRERVVSAAAILEDGSINAAAGNTGSAEAPRNLVDEFTDRALQQLGWTTKEAALAFFKAHPAEDFSWLRVAVRLPTLPDYYAPNMDLSLVIDRGDVYYDAPFDEKGKERSQSRNAFPSLTLYLNHNGQKRPLVRWRTTIGGWRSEQAADGYEYFRYKGSDVGPRVIRNVISGPVWIAPESTPIRTLVKGKSVRGTYQGVVNYDEIGPGFRSAYGLVAGYFVVPGVDGKPDFDNGIRAHGSAEYLSINSSEGFSHGCHRLHNHLAVRLYSFILSHRNIRVVGDLVLNSGRSFLYKDDIYELRIPSRGFAYVLEPPLPVNVLEGNIKGERKTPITEYVPKPGVVYPGAPPPLPGQKGEDRSGGTEAAVESAPKGGKP